MPRRCWLCEFNKDHDAKMLHAFIVENVGHMGKDQLAAEIHENLVQMVPNAEGIGLDDVVEHIGSHTLNPSVRVASMLHSLLDVKDKIEGVLTVQDEDGNTAIDGKNVAVYLKVVNEIMQIYKAGPPVKFMFSSHHQGEQDSQAKKD